MMTKRSLLVLSVIVVLVAALAVWLNKAVFFDPDALDYYREGRSNAIADLRNGRFKIKDDQSDTLRERIYKEDLQKDHGIARDALNVDRVHVQLTEYIRGYNEVMAPAIRDHLGRAKLNRLERHVGEELEQRTQTAEYGVYSAVMGEIEQDGAMILVLGDKTWDRLSSLEPEVRTRFPLRQMVEDWNTPPLEPLSPSRVEAIEDYEAKNNTPVLLNQHFDVRSKCLLLSENAFATLFTRSKNALDAWKDYYKKYPHSPGYIRLSRVGFNRPLTEALIYVERQCGSLCADGSFKLLAKEGDRWTIKNSIPFYAS